MVRLPPASVTGLENATATLIAAPAPYVPSAVAEVIAVITGATASMTIVRLSLSDWPGGIVRTTGLPAASAREAPAARASGELLSSGLAVWPAATVPVTVTLVRLGNGGIVTLPPLLRFTTRPPPVSVTGPSNV